MSFRGSRLATIAALLAGSGCTYLRDRANDLLDPFRVDVGVGFGLYADARATDFVATGVGVHALHAAGWHGRHVGTGELGGLGLGLLMLGDAEFAMSPLLGEPASFVRAHDVVPGQLLVFACNGMKCGLVRYTLAERGLHVADVGASATIGVVGVGLGFSPGELLDCLLGFFGIDIAGDDARPSEPTTMPTTTTAEAPKREPEPPQARER